ncbi:cobalamin B12-binding domain-containing protein, partial [uncultured Xanthomonas sp.]
MSSTPNTLLVNPTIAKPSSARFPLSLLNLAAALDRTGDSRIIDGNVDRDFIDRSLQALQEQRFDAVGISVMGGPQLAPSIALSQAIRARFPALPIVWGGYFPTLYPDTALAAPYVDYAIRAQGEDTLPELLAALRGEGPTLAQV